MNAPAGSPRRVPAGASSRGNSCKFTERGALTLKAVDGQALTLPSPAAQLRAPDTDQPTFFWGVSNPGTCFPTSARSPLQNERTERFV